LTFDQFKIFKTSDYDFNIYERSAKYKDNNLILCETCNQKINNIICFGCYVKAPNHEKEYPTTIGMCKGCFEIIKDYDGCFFCKQKRAFINFINYLWGLTKFKDYHISCLKCDQNIDRLIICFNCHDKETNDEEKNRMMFGKCKECSQAKTGLYGCSHCNSKQFQQDKWNSGNTDIDELIRHKQMSARNLNDVLEWIPYDRFKDVKYIAEGGFAKVYSATWIDGYIINWNQESNNWKRSRSFKVALKVLKNSRDISKDFLNEVLKKNNNINNV